MTWGMIGGAAVSVVGGALLGGSKGGSSQSGTQTTTQQQTLDPRIAGAVFGSGNRTLKPGVTPQYDMAGQLLNPDTDFNTDSGILGRNTALFDRPQDPLMAQYGADMQKYLGNTTQDMGAMRQAATGLLSGITAPQMQAASMAAPAPMIAAQQGVTDMTATKQGVAQMGAANQGVVNMSAANMGQGTQADATSYAAARINAPGQNNLGLAPAYQDMVYGAPGANPYLTGAIGKGINQSQNAFGQMQDDSTRNLMETILPSLRSSSILSGQYGGSRQGIAEGRAVGDFAREQQRAISQFGQNNTDAAVGAQAGAYDADRSRALSAMGNLSGSQYGVAGQQAGMDTQAARDNAAATNAASLFNAGVRNNASQTNAGFQQQANATNAGAGNAAMGNNAQFQQQASAANMGALNTGYGADANRQQQANMTNAGASNAAAGNNAQFAQQANATNYGGLLDVGRTNAGFQQGANQSNLQSQIGTNSLNSSNTQAGIGALGGLLGTASQAGSNQDSYALNQAGKVNSLLTPYVGLGSGSTTNQPLYQNQGGNALSGALTGLGLYRGITGLTGNASGTQNLGYDPYAWTPGYY